MAFEGGPLTFHPRLIRVFAERLELSEEDILIPEHPELMVAYGAALSLGSMLQAEGKPLTVQELADQLAGMDRRAGRRSQTKPFFASPEERKAFEKRPRKKNTRWTPPKGGSRNRANLGIESGSTPNKVVMSN